MKSAYKVSTKSQLFILTVLIQFAAGFYLGYLVVTWYLPDNGSSAQSIFVFGYLITQVLPCTFVHFQYLKYNEDMELTVDKISRTMMITNEGKTYSFSLSQIKKVRIGLNNYIFGGARGGFYSVHVYHFAMLETENGDRFIITCLLVNDLRKFFKDLGIEFTKDRVIFPFVMMSKYREKNPDGW